MRCLILGGSGLIGSSLVAVAEGRGYPFLASSYTRTRPGFTPLDLRDAEAIDDLIADYEPEVTILAAGPSDARAAELDPIACWKTLVDGTKRVTDAVARTGGVLVKISSDEVFGECRTARKETDDVAPVGELATCHADAEAVVRNGLPDRHLIVRTGWVFGAPGQDRSFATKLIRKIASGVRVLAADDRYGQPTYAPDLAEAILDLASVGQTGTVHAVGPDRQTEFTFARLLAHVYGFDADRIDPTPMTHLRDDNPRPNRVWLDRSLLRSLLGPKVIRSTADALRTMRDANRTPALARVA